VGAGGRAVVVTRAAGGGDDLPARLRAAGLEVRELPAIELGPPADPGPLDAALRDLPRFDWVAFASAAAVDRVLARLDALGLPRAALSERSLAAVGPATAERLRAGLRAADLVPEEAAGAALARALAGTPAPLAGRRVLLPRAAEGRPELHDGLVAAGAAVTAVEAYRTVPASPERLAPLARWLRAGEVAAVAFSSPSAVRAVAAALERAQLAAVLLAAIGPTTAAALEEAGLPVGLVAGRHTGADLAQAIAARLRAG
jgi:uroporphyrinogen-III synthase